MSSLTDTIYHQIYDDIMMMNLKPGERLHIAELAAHYGVGLSPIREALAKLTATDFVIAIPQKGFRVAEMSVADLNDIYATRTYIEQLALKLSIERGDEAWEAAILSSYHLLEQFEKKMEQATVDAYQEWEKRHRAFTFALVSACGLKHLLEVHQKLYQLTERYRRMWVRLSLEEKKPVQYALKQKPILQASLDRDVERALLLHHQHFERAVKHVASSL